MKTIIARFQELKDLGAIEETGEDVNKVEKALKSAGVELLDANKQFRDLDDVFLELSSKWDTLDRNTQRYIATIAAGSRQQSRFIAMMDNYERTLELVDIANNSAGQSQIQHAKTLDGIEAKLNKLQSTFQEFYTKVFNSNVFKALIDSLNTVLSLINKLPGSLAVVGSLMVIVFAKPVITGLLNGVKDGWRAVASGANSDAFAAGAANQKAYDKGRQTSKYANAAGGFDIGDENSTLSGRVESKISSSISGALSKASSTGIVQGITSVAKAAFPMVAVLGIATTISSTIQDKITSSVQEAVEDAQMKATQSASDYRTLSSDVDKLRDLANQQVKTNEEKQEFLTLQKEIASQYPELINGYDEEGNAIVKLGQDLDDLIQKKKEAALTDELKATREELRQISMERAKASSAGIDTAKELEYQGMTQEELNRTIQESITEEQRQILVQYNKDFSNKLKAGLETSFTLAISGLDLTQEQKQFLEGFKNSFIENLMLNEQDAKELLDPETFSNQIRELTNAISSTTSSQREQFEYLIENFNNLSGEEIDTLANRLKKEFSSSESTKYLSDFIDANLEGLRERKTEVQNSFAEILLPDSATQQEIEEKGKELGEQFSLGYMEAMNSAFRGKKGSFEYFTNQINAIGDENVRNQVVSSLANFDFGQATDIAEFRKELVDLGVSAEIVSNILWSLPDATERAGFTLRGTITDIDNYNTQLKNMSDLSARAMQGQLTMDDVLTILDNDASITAENFQQVGETWQLVGRTAYDLENSFRANTQSIYANRIALAQNDLQLLIHQREVETDIEKQAELDRQIKETSNSIILLSNAYENMPQLNIQQDAFSTITSAFGQMEEGAKAVSSALQEMSDSGKVSLSTVQALIDAGPEYAAALDVQNGAIVLNKEAIASLDEARQIEYENMIEMKIGQVEAEKATVDAQIEAVKAIINALQTGLNYEQAVAQSKVLIANQEIKSDTSVANSSIESANAVASSAQQKAQNEATASQDIARAANSQITSFKGVAQAAIDAANGKVSGASAGSGVSASGGYSTSGKRVYTDTSGNLTSIGYRESTYELSKYLQSSGSNASSEGFAQYLRENTVSMDKVQVPAFQAALADLETQSLNLGKELELLKKLKNLNINDIIADEIGGGSGGKKGSSSKAKKELDEYISKLEKFYNMLQKIANLEYKKDMLESQRELIDNVDELSENLSESYQTSKDLQNAYSQMNNLQKQEMKDLQAQIESTYGGYVTFEKGYLEIYYDKITTLDKERGEALEKLIDKYDEAKEAVKDYTDKIRDEAKYQKELIRQQKENIQTVEEKISALLIQEDEKRIESVKKRYDLIKKENQKYLNSVRQSLNEERNLRDKQNQYSDLESKEKRLALLQRDTSGIYAREILQLEQEIAQQRQDLSDQEIDDTLDKIEERLNAQSDAYDKEIEYLETAQQIKVESMTAYWEQVNQIMSGGLTSIIDFMKKYDTEFIQGSKTMQDIWIEDWEENVRKALAAMKSLENQMKPTTNIGGGSSSSGGGSNSGNSGSTSTAPPPVKTPTVGGRVKANPNASIYTTMYGGGARHQYYDYDPIYTILEERGSFYKVRYHKLASGVSGWLRKGDVTAYKTGGLVDYTGIAQVDGTKNKPEAFLSAKDTKNFTTLKDVLAKVVSGTKFDFSKDAQNNEVKQAIIYVNIDEIASDYDVDDAVARLKKDIMDSSKYNNVKIVNNRSR